MSASFDARAVGRRVLITEAEGLALLADSLDGAFSRTVACMAALKGRVVCTGVGKSGHVARKIAATLASTGTPALFVHAVEASHGDLGMITGDDVVLALSKSGEASELDAIAAYCRRFGIPLIALTTAPESPLATAADIVLALPDAPEAAAALNAPTTSTTLQIAMGDALAVALLEWRGFTAADFSALHPGGKLGAALRSVASLMHDLDQTPLVSPETPMHEALLVMTERRFGCVGVVGADGRLQGIVTDGDLRRHMEGLLGHTAGEVMTAGPKTVAPETLAVEALKLMNEAPLVTVLFVVRDCRPVGILHIHDLLRAGVV